MKPFALTWNCWILSLSRLSIVEPRSIHEMLACAVAGKRTRVFCHWFACMGLLLFSVVGRAEEARAFKPTKRVEIDKTAQVLRAYENDQLVFQSRVSTGRWSRSTPNGQFSAGGKQRMHYSRLYHNAPMPYSVEVCGNVFIHGFNYVPAWPASHGCIRMPLDGGNPAKRFYDWVEVGTPIVISGQWAGGH